jgi:hypothetical protein
MALGSWKRGIFKSGFRLEFISLRWAGMTVEGFRGATEARISIRQRKSLTGWRSVD